MACYLLHFSEPIGNPSNSRGQAQHYLGCTDLPVQKRLAQHRAGQGAKITRAAVSKGITLNLVRVWEGDFEMERWLKESHNNKIYCSVCSPERFTLIDLAIQAIQEKKLCSN